MLASLSFPESLLEFQTLFGVGLLVLGVGLMLLGFRSGSRTRLDSARATAWGTVSLVIGGSVFSTNGMADGVMLGLPNVQAACVLVSSLVLAAIVGLQIARIVRWTFSTQSTS